MQISYVERWRCRRARASRKSEIALADIPFQVAWSYFSSSDKRSFFVHRSERPYALRVRSGCDPLLQVDRERFRPSLYPATDERKDGFTVRLGARKGKATFSTPAAAKRQIAVLHYQAACRRILWVVSERLSVILTIRGCL